RLSLHAVRVLGAGAVGLIARSGTARGSHGRGQSGPSPVRGRAFSKGRRCLATSAVPATKEEKPMSMNNRRGSRGRGRPAKGRGNHPATSGGPRGHQTVDTRRTAVITGPVVLGTVMSVGELADALGISPV